MRARVKSRRASLVSHGRVHRDIRKDLLVRLESLTKRGRVAPSDVAVAPLGGEFKPLTRVGTVPEDYGQRKDVSGVTRKEEGGHSRPNRYVQKMPECEPSPPGSVMLASKLL